MVNKNEKLCFVIMGFGKKKDPDTNRTIDLDETYKKIILPAVQSCKYKCVRADEILDSGIIDRSMYALLYSAELVIADISTYNPNAIYELGARHILKPYSTIIIKENRGKIPFDIDHNRILSYEHSGDEISKEETTTCIKKLKEKIDCITKKPLIDSPLYSYIPNIKKPILSKLDLKKIIGDLKNNENTIYSLTEKAKSYMKENKFTESAAIWKKLREKVEHENYYIQQEALCTYKSEKPNKLQALTDALQIMSKIAEQSDTETLGILGAINKRLWVTTCEKSFLETAIAFYKKGWTLYGDYYTGENYAHCMEQKSTLENGDNSIYCKVEAKNTREEIINIILKSLEDTDPEELKWKYATLSNCYLAIGYISKAKQYKIKFMQEGVADWEVDTFNKSKQDIIKYTSKK